MASKRDQKLANIAKRHGANYSLRIVMEARRAGIPISLGFALIEQESDFRNVYGHDDTLSVPKSLPRGQSPRHYPVQGGIVTARNWKVYLSRRGSTGRGGMQGAGPGQLTYYTFQDRADALGGCWIAANNIRVAFTDLAAMIDRHGKRKGLGVYNAGERGWVKGLGHKYADQVLAKERRWHDRLTA